MDRGYVKLWRKIEDSGLFGFPNQFAIFSYLLIRAAHKPYTYPDGNCVEVGQVITSVNKLSTITGLSRQVVRTALKGLVAAERITLATSNKYTLVTIQQYLQYNPTATNIQPTPNQPLTTIKNSNSKEESFNQGLRRSRREEVRDTRPRIPFTDEGGL